MASDPLRLTWWKLWFRWRGRIGREWFWLGSFIVLVLAGAGSAAAFSFAQQRMEYMAGGGIVALIGVHALVAIIIKRLHDRNISAWWIILYCAVPIGLAGAIPQLKILSPEYWWIAAAVAGLIGLWTLITLGFRRGTKGANRYGEAAMDEPPIEPVSRPPPVRSST